MCSAQMLVLLVAAVLLRVTPLEAKPVCGKDEYYGLVGRRCLPCSKCPDYLIVLHTCTLHSDTMCGHLDFEFLQVPSNSDGTQHEHQSASESSSASSKSSNSDIHSENSGTLSLVILTFCKPIRVEYLLFFGLSANLNTLLIICYNVTSLVGLGLLRQPLLF